MDDSVDIYDDSYLYVADAQHVNDSDVAGGLPLGVSAADDDVFAGYADEKMHDVAYSAVSDTPREHAADATSALQIDELSWWTSDDDLTTIAAQAVGEASCVKDIGFFEHKVNGKSRGIAWLLLNSVDAAVKTKQRLESIEIDKRHPIVNFANPTYNPYRTMPKEAPKAVIPTARGNTFNRAYLPRPQITGRGIPPPHTAYRPQNYPPHMQVGQPPPTGYRPRPIYGAGGSGMMYAMGGIPPGGASGAGYRPRPPLPASGYGYDAGLENIYGGRGGRGRGGYGPPPPAGGGGPGFNYY